MAVVILGEGSPRDRQSLELQTRARRHIPNVLIEGERAPDSLRAAVRLMESTYDSARCLSASALYNCAGLVFGSRRTWIEPEHAEWILRDDGYGPVTRVADWDCGDVVLYQRDGETSHIAAILAVERSVALADHRFTVVSQWGRDGEYVHELNDVPVLLGIPSAVWSKRNVHR